MQRSVDFTLDIYGTGSLAAGIARAIAEEGLGGRVRLHNPVDFETGLVPVLRREADAFLSCHRQADPSCTYLESMGCGLPVVGYDNAMWRALMQDSGAGWSVRLGDTAALAACIAGLLPEAVTGAAERSRTYAQAHDFESEFAKRMDHLARVLARRKH
jgi:glycosyltransferase involved in cell wall biosynthesis